MLIELLFLYSYIRKNKKAKQFRHPRPGVDPRIKAPWLFKPHEMSTVKDHINFAAALNMIVCSQFGKTFVANYQNLTESDGIEVNTIAEIVMLLCFGEKFSSPNISVLLEKLPNILRQ